jgi:hypothetical protein
MPDDAPLPDPRDDEFYARYLESCRRPRRRAGDARASARVERSDRRRDAPRIRPADEALTHQTAPTAEWGEKRMDAGRCGSKSVKGFPREGCKLRTTNIIRTIAAITILSCSCAVDAASVDVVVESLDKPAQDCGISSSQLESLARLTLRNNRVQPTTDKTGAYLYVRVTAVGGTGFCAAAIHVAIMAPLPITGSSGFTVPKSRGIAAVLCESGSMLSGPQSNIASRVSIDVEDLTKQCLGSLDY